MRYNHVRQPKPRNAAEAYNRSSAGSVVWSVIVLIIIIAILVHL